MNPDEMKAALEGYMMLFRLGDAVPTDEGWRSGRYQLVKKVAMLALGLPDDEQDERLPSAGEPA